jgi:UMF1 family MFS transporter
MVFSLKMSYSSFSDFKSHLAEKRESQEDLELNVLESKVELSRDFSDDHPEVSRYEKIGWYLYAFCSESYASSAITLFIPLILEQLAWEAGTSTIGGIEKCVKGSDAQPSPCFVSFLGTYISPVSFALYVSSISVICQVLSFISLGAFADYSDKRKKFLTFFTLFGSLMCILFLVVVGPQMYMVAAVLTILSNICFGCSMVFYNAYLPLLVDAEPEVRKMKALLEYTLHEAHESDQKFEQEKKNAFNDLHSVKDRLFNETSSKGTIYSYSGGVLSIIVLGVFLFVSNKYYPDSIYPSQICVALVGVFWALIYLLTSFKRLKTRPGPPFPVSGGSILLLGWKNTISSFGNVPKLKNVFLFLLAWFFFSDSMNTISSVAVLFGKGQLHMKVSELFIMAIIAPFFAIIGNFIFLNIFYKRLKWSSKSILLFLIVLLTLIPAYGLLGFVIPPSYGFGLRNSWEIYALGAFYGICLGGITSFSRTLFSEMIPAGMESEFFALYSITDKGSSWLGPLLCGVMESSFGNIRYSFFVLILFIMIALPFLFSVNVKQGKEDAKKFK